MNMIKALSILSVMALPFMAPVEARAQAKVAMLETQKMDVTATSGISAPRRLVITDQPISNATPSAASVYQSPRQVGDITASQILNSDSAGFTGMAGNKVTELSNDLFKLQGEIARLSDQLLKLELNSQQKAAEYYASTATISTQLQTGTTPGNPRLVSKLDMARQNLDALSNSVSDFNALAIDASNQATVSAFLLDSIRSAYGLSGSTEQDHAQLAQLEDAVLGSTVVVERLLNNINDDISRSAAYLSAERSNLRTLSLAVSNGELYGRSLANRPFANVQQSEIAARYQNAGYATAPRSPNAQLPNPGSLTSGPLMFDNETTAGLTSVTAQPAQPRPLMTIRFDKANVAYQQPLYVAVNEAMEVYPDAQFEVVAVAPGQGNAAKLAIENSKSRRNAEDVLRSMSQMGVNAEKVILSSSTNPNSDVAEVQLYIR